MNLWKFEHQISLRFIFFLLFVNKVDILTSLLSFAGMRINIPLIILLLFTSAIRAEEGMWIPLLIQQYNIDEMKTMGLQLNFDEIYSSDSTSLKDAVVIFGGGCTGAIISNDGLLATNHHCGYRNIQYHSSLEHDYLTDGFWAMSRKEELPNPGLTVRILEYMEDVTGKVINISPEKFSSEYEKLKKDNIIKIEKEASEEGKFFAEVKPLFYGNKYYLYVYKIYSDVRLVGAPPSSIGKFGGDTDNWMWPRHTGDFSLFRIYAGKNNEPAEYSQENVPYKPKTYFSISLQGINPGDFTMVYGNPGRTMQYIPSHEVKIIMNSRNPVRIGIRDKKLDIIKSYMESDPKTRILYSARYASISNAWKKWQGELAGLERLDAVNKKLAFEDDFKRWLQSDEVREAEYAGIFQNFDSLYNIYREYIVAGDHYSEILLRDLGVFRAAGNLDNIIKFYENKQDNQAGSMLPGLIDYMTVFYREHNMALEEELFEELIPMLGDELDDKFLPADYNYIMDKYGRDKLIQKVFRRSVLNDSLKLFKVLKDGNRIKLLKLSDDPLVKLANRLSIHYDVYIKPALDSVSAGIARNMHTYMKGIMEMQNGKTLYPDANGTLRLAYGKVEGYEPADGLEYKYYTTIEGIMEKDDPDIYDYDVPESLRNLYDKKDYGSYGDEDYLPVCFTASNHTSGGNSGSPVLNSKGELIGLNFDRCWEGTMSDIIYDPERCRNIALDIRYALFIIDKFAGAGYLLDEMNIIY